MTPFCKARWADNWSPEQTNAAAAASSNAIPADGIEVLSNLWAARLAAGNAGTGTAAMAGGLPTLVAAATSEQVVADFTKAMRRTAGTTAAAESGGVEISNLEEDEDEDDPLDDDSDEEDDDLEGDMEAAQQNLVAFDPQSQQELSLQHLQLLNQLQVIFCFFKNCKMETVLFKVFSYFFLKVRLSNFWKTKLLHFLNY